MKGVGISRNTAAEAAHYELLAYIDSDCVASSGWLKELVPVFQDVRIAAVGGMIRAYEPHTLLGAHDGLGQAVGVLRGRLHQIERQALRGLGTDPRQPGQLVDEVLDRPFEHLGDGLSGLPGLLHLGTELRPERSQGVLFGLYHSEWHLALDTLGDQLFVAGFEYV